MKYYVGRCRARTWMARVTKILRGDRNVMGRGKGNRVKRMGRVHVLRSIGVL